MKRADLGDYEAKWKLSEELLPRGRRRAARQMLGRLVRLGQPMLDGTVAKLMQNLQESRSTPGSRREALSALRSALEVIEPGRFGPMIIAAERAVVDTSAHASKKKYSARRTTPLRRGLAVHDWRPEKREAWLSATAEDGKLAILSNRRLETMRSALGLLYRFQEQSGRIDLSPATWESFVGHVQQGLAPSTLANYATLIYVGERAFLKMARERFANDEFEDADAVVAEEENEFGAADEILIAAAEFADADNIIERIVDDGELQWLLKEVRRLRRLAGHAGTIADKMQYRVPLEDVFQAGLDTMAEAERMPYGNAACLLYRAGWLVAFLSTRPVRIGTAAATDVEQATSNRGCLEIGPDGAMHMRWPPAAVKNRMEILAKIKPELVPNTLRWLEYFRPGLYGADTCDAFFVGNHAGPVTVKALRLDFEAVMFRRFGKRTPPHMIRSIVAAFVAEEAPMAALAGMITVLLGHSSEREDEPYRGMIRAEAAQDRLTAAMSALKRSGRVASQTRFSGETDPQGHVSR